MHDIQTREARTQAADAFLRRLPNGLRSRLDVLSSGMDEDRARSRIATLTVLTALQLAVSILALSHLHHVPGAIESIAFSLCLALSFNGAAALVCLSAARRESAAPIA